MEELISIEHLIEEAKTKGIDFGKGDPYNRLRYYTKIGWLPHMVRKKDENGNTRGHYYHSAIDRLVTIETLKAKGLSNDEISKELKVKNRLQTFVEMVKTPEMRNQIVTYTTLGILVLIMSNELGIIRLGRTKSVLGGTETGATTINGPKQLIDSGTAFVPKNQKKLFIQTPLIKNDYKVYVTFSSDYSPAARFWVSSIDDYKGFTVELDTPVFSNSEFNWWITN
jgi:DNA-binding transcriptional MerR regulator